MALRKIVTEGDPVLRKRAREIEKVSSKEQMIFDDMVETMRESNGCGLAAPQVGLLKRMIVFEVPDTSCEIEEGQEEKHILYQLANPEIISMSGSQVGEEGCLSVPGFIGNVDRPLTIQVKALDYNGELIEINGNGFLSVVLSHEIDHLNGVLFTDKATDIEALEDQET